MHVPPEVCWNVKVKKRPYVVFVAVTWVEFSIFHLEGTGRAREILARCFS